MYNVLFNRENVDNTRAYLLREFGLGVNMPFIHIEEQTRYAHPSYKFVIATYTYNKVGKDRGLFLLEGRYTFDTLKATIIECNIVYVWQPKPSKENYNFYYKWICDNIPWVGNMMKQGIVD